MVSWFWSQVNDHKMRIEVDGGLQGVLTDALASQIIRNEMAPSLSVRRLLRRPSGPALPPSTKPSMANIRPPMFPRHPQHAPTVDVGSLLFWMIVFIVILASHVRFRRYRNQWLGPVLDIKPHKAVSAAAVRPAGAAVSPAVVAATRGRRGRRL